MSNIIKFPEKEAEEIVAVCPECDCAHFYIHQPGDPYHVETGTILECIDCGTGILLVEEE